MTARSFASIAAAVFALVALAHLLRALMGWPVVIDGVAVPMWLSWVVFVALGALSIAGFRAR